MDGILIVDKPAGMTSHDVVFRVRKLLQEPRIGHTGTLDPMATGVLVLCVGRATKLVPYLTDHDKRYEAEVCLGIETDTLDVDGTVLRQIPCPEIPESRIDAVLERFLGNQMQIPPNYSAIKVDGRKLYEYAR
ncbi:MAG TPA: tRNA pseudouridine(55) synthase TruB, partial [Candidatus Izemoplasmatales bacterium]|nr:tRNA pseudouridine(55) synthase TruB [Candidatus Izemoplasmatales bacterium]